MTIIKTMGVMISTQGHQPYPVEISVMVIKPLRDRRCSKELDQQVAKTTSARQAERAVFAA